MHKLAVNQLLRDGGFDSLGSHVDMFDFTRLLDGTGFAVAVLGFLVISAAGKRSSGAVAIGLAMMLVGGGIILSSMAGI